MQKNSMWAFLAAVSFSLGALANAGTNKDSDFAVVTSGNSPRFKSAQLLDTFELSQNPNHNALLYSDHSIDELKSALNAALSVR